MALAGELTKYIGGELAKNTGKELAIKMGQQAIQEASSDVLRNAITDIVTKNSIDLTSKGFGKQILSGLRQKAFNSPATEAQALVDAFPKLYRTDFGVDGNDMISQLKNDGGAVLSGYAKFDNVNTGKGTRRLGISRDSFDRFFKEPQNSFLANPRMEVGGSPRTSELYPNNKLRNAQDVLSDLRNKVLDYYTADPNNSELINSIPNIYGADDYASGILEEIAKSNSPVSHINEFKMAMGPRDISAISDMNFGNTRKLINDVPLTLANGETINVPANSLFGNFDGIREQLYDVPKGMTTDSGYKYAGSTLAKDALKKEPRVAIYNKLVEDYGPDRTREIMAYYGGDIGKSAKSGQNSFLGRLLTGEEVESPMVMYHGVGTDKLKDMLGLAERTSSEYAIPNPSLQVVNPNVNAGSSYGDVVLLGNKSMPGGINPYTGGPDLGSKYNLYSRDIYSPRKPHIEDNKEGIPYISGTRQVATPANISKYMNKQGAISSESDWFSPGSMAATQSQRFKSPLDAVKNIDLLKAQAELDEAFDAWNSEVSGGISQFLDKYMEKNPGENRFMVGDYIGEELQNAMSGKPAWEGDPYGIWTDKGKEVVSDLKKKAANLPTAYFEAKSNRAVPLREFSGAILPEGYSDEKVLQALKDSGVSVLGSYDPNNYQNSMQSTLRSLIKDKDRFNTPYMMSKVEPDVALSPEQKEFFKDSVIRDENGNLVPVYHSTPSKFTVFDNTKLGGNTGYSNTGFGHFVTTDKDFSSRFKDIDGNGLNGSTMELYANVKNPIVHPYMAGNKYSEEELDAIVENYYKAIGAEDSLQTLREYAAEDGQSLYDEYMDMTVGEDPFEAAAEERKILEKNGYDAVEIVEGPKSGLVEGSNDDSIVSSYAIFDGKNLKNADNLNPTSNSDIRLAKKNGPSLTEIANRIKAMNKAESLDGGVKRIGNSEVAGIDANTLPAGYEKVKKYLGSSDADRIEEYTGANLEKDSIEEYTNKLKKFLEEEDYDSDKTGAELMRDVRAAINEKMANDLNMEGSTLYKNFFQTRGRLQKDNPLVGVGPSSFTISADKDKLYQTDAAKLDAEYSERLGIGRSHIPMSDKSLSSEAQGYYMGGGIGINPRYASGESGVSTIAHERMHGWQDINKVEWDSRVGDAIDELRNELKKHYHTKAEIKDYRKSGSDLDYYANEHEQEARMLQSYLDNEGFTKTWRKQAGEPTEWGDEIKPAFDKFYKKLRALSKAGVALPGIAVLFGLSANGGENKEKTY